MCDNQRYNLDLDSGKAYVKCAICGEKILYWPDEQQKPFQICEDCCSILRLVIRRELCLIDFDSFAAHKEVSNDAT